MPQSRHCVPSHCIKQLSWNQKRDPDKVTKVDSEQWAQSVTCLLHSATFSNMKKIKCQQIPNNHSATECFVSCKVVQEAKQQHNIKPLDFSTAACGQNHHLKDSKTNENTWFHAYGGITNSYVWSQSSDFQIPRSVSLPCLTTPTDMPRVKFLPVRLWKELYCIRLEGALVKCFNLSAAFCRTSNWASRKSQPQLGCRVNQEQSLTSDTSEALSPSDSERFSESQETLVKSLFDILQLHDFGGSYSASKQSRLQRSNSLSMHVTPLKQDEHIGKIGTNNSKSNRLQMVPRQQRAIEHHKLPLWSTQPSSA